jgi:hypothetical protein
MRLAGSVGQHWSASLPALVSFVGEHWSALSAALVSPVWSALVSSVGSTGQFRWQHWLVPLSRGQPRWAALVSSVEPWSVPLAALVSSADSISKLDHAPLRYYRTLLRDALLPGTPLVLAR